MKYTRHNAAFYTAAAFFFFNTLLSMDTVGTIIDNTSQVLTLVIQHKHLSCDYKDISSLAVVNKLCKKLIKGTIQERKTYITNLLQEYDEDCVLVWNKYSSACGNKTSGYTDDGIPWVALNAWYLKKGNIVRYFSCYDNFRKCIPSFEKPFFDERNNQFTLYAFGKEGDMMLWDENWHIVEYSLSEESSSTHRCGVSVSEFRNFALSHFTDFPVLLKLFLSCGRKFRYVCDIGKLYSLENLIIPDNYKECVPSLEYQSFDDLPEELQDAINTRYDEQQKK